MRRTLAGAATIAAVLAVGLTLAAQSSIRQGVQDPAWAPGGKQLAISFFDRIWLTGADGRERWRQDIPAASLSPLQPSP